MTSAFKTVQAFRARDHWRRRQYFSNHNRAAGAPARHATPLPSGPCNIIGIRGAHVPTRPCQIQYGQE